MSIELIGVIAVALVLAIAYQQIRWRAACRAVAEKIYRELAGTYGGEHEYAVVSPAEFVHVDQAGYQRLREHLEARGFVRLGAVENLTATRVYPQYRTFLDFYSHPSEPVGVATYLLEGRQTIEICTALEGGRFLITTTEERDALTPPPEIDKETRPHSTPVDELLARHLLRLATLRKRDPAARFIPLDTLERAVAALKAHSRLVSDYRRKLGYLTEEEMRGFAQGRGQGPAARRIWREFVKLRGQSGAAVERAHAADDGAES